MSTLMLQTNEGFTLPCEIGLAFDPWDNDALLDFCARNKGLNIERSARGEIIIMSPTGWEGGFHDSQVFQQLGIWADRDGRGIATGATPGFLFPDGAMRSPDASWILLKRFATVSPAQRKKFLPLVPDFVIEVRSESDSLSMLLEKMEQYRDNGVALGWLIDPREKRVHVYDARGGVIVLDAPEQVVGSGPVDGFILHMRRIWNPPFVGGEG